MVVWEVLLLLPERWRVVTLWLAARRAVRMCGPRLPEEPARVTLREGMVAVCCC